MAVDPRAASMEAAPGIRVHRASTQINPRSTPGQPGRRRTRVRRELRWLLSSGLAEADTRWPVMSSVSQELGVFRSFTAHRGPVVAGRAVDVARLIDAVRAGGLAVVLITVS